MTPAERERMAVACCLICTVAEALKACQVCPFRVGLAIKAEQAKQKENTVFSSHLSSSKGE